MLEKQVDGPRRRRELVVAAVVLLGCGASLAVWSWLALSRAPAIVVIPTVVPPAQVNVQLLGSPVPPIAPAAAPPAPPVAPGPAPVVATTCVGDVSTIGMPLGDAVPREQSLDGATASPDGCTIAAWTADTMYISWDGGQTFLQLVVPGSLDRVAAVSGRVVVVRDRRALGVVRAGDAAFTWRDITGLAERDADRNTQLELVVGGRWSVVAAAKLVVATDDDGATWRYLTPPPSDARLAAVSAAGRLTATAVVAIQPPIADYGGYDGAPVERKTRRFEAGLHDGRWRTLPVRVGSEVAATRSWSYALANDRFWGCGGSQKLIAIRGGRRITVAGDLRAEVYDISIAANADVVFLGHGHLFRVTGTRIENLGELPPYGERIVAVDGYGSPLVLGGSGLLRWSAGGGWRVLLPVP